MTRTLARVGAGLLSLGLAFGSSAPPAWGQLAPQTGAAPTPPRPSADPRFDATLSALGYPFPVQRFVLWAQGQRLSMAYLDVGRNRPQRETVLLLHGKNFGAAYWAPTVRFLVARGHRVVVPEQIGFGKSDKPHDFQFSFHGMAAHTRSLLAHLGVAKVAVVGHSMGGMLATRFALQHPALVGKLVLVNPIGLEDWAAKGVPYRSVDDWYTRELQATPDSIRAYQRASYYGGHWRPEHEALMASTAGQTQHPDYPKVAWCSARAYEAIFTQPVVHDFPRLRVPTLLVIGQRDRTALGKDAVAPDLAASLGDYPRLGRAAQAAISGARLVELEGVGHLPQVEAFEAYAQALGDFLLPPPPRP